MDARLAVAAPKFSVHVIGALIVAHVNVRPLWARVVCRVYRVYRVYRVHRVGRVAALGLGQRDRDH